MKTEINFVHFLLTLLTLVTTGVVTANAQAIQVTPNANAGANFDVTAQTRFYYKGNSDGFHLRTDNAAALPGSGNDLMWMTFAQAQPNNPGILGITSVSAGISWSSCFQIRANGNVGIFNEYPSAALEVGSSGSIRQVKVNGSVVFGSDARMKENIRDISNSLDKLRQLRSVSYNFKEDNREQPIPEKFMGDGIDTEKMKAEFKSAPKTNQDLLNRSFYGFLAQDVQKLFPDLVFADSAGMLSVDYIGIIPLLVNGLKEQQEQIERQQHQIEELQAAVFSNIFRSGTQAEEGTGVAKANIEAAVLYQNAPNPFSTQTTIHYFLPESIKTADIYIFNMQGIVVKQILANRSGMVEIQGSDLQAGMYLYSLVADGKEVDTKRMILTK